MLIKRILMLIALMLCLMPRALATEKDRVLFINVGDADAMVVQTGGQSFLIDTGRKQSAPQLYAGLAALHIMSLDGVFLTHSDSDHIGGMAALAQRVNIQKVYCAAIGEANKSGAMKTAEAARKQGIEPVLLSFGDRVPAGSTFFEVLGPLVLDTVDDNDNSLVLKITLNGQVFLFAGDMQYMEEKTLLNKGVDLKADVLKVGNHGNRDATSPQFARAVSPTLAIFSADTTADSNSAHPQVMRLLSTAKSLVTQQAALGILVEAGKDGLHTTLVSPTDKTLNGITLQVDSAAHTVTLSGEGDLSGCFLFADKGGDLFLFPEGTMLQKGKPLVVAADHGTGDIKWQKKNIIHPSKPDALTLYDQYGNVIDSFVSR